MTESRELDKERIRKLKILGENFRLATRNERAAEGIKHVVCAKCDNGYDYKGDTVPPCPICSNKVMNDELCSMDRGDDGFD